METLDFGNAVVGNEKLISRALAGPFTFGLLRNLIAILLVSPISPLICVELLAKTVPLETAVEKGIERSEAVGRQTAIKSRLELSHNKARGALFPTIEFRKQWQRQDIPPAAPGSEIPRAFRLQEQRTSAFSATQPIFMGGAEWDFLQQTKHNLEGAEHDLAAVKLNEKISVGKLHIETFYLNRLTEIAKDIQGTLQSRYQTMRNKVRIGRFAPSELLLTQAQLETISAQTQANEVNHDLKLIEWRSRLGFEQEVPQYESANVVKAPSENAVEAIVTSHPSLLALNKRIQAQQESVDIARSGHWPTLELSGNYYLERPGILADSKWDISLVLTIPLFSGMTVMSATREEAYTKVALERDYELLRREITEKLKGLIRQYRQLKQANERYQKASVLMTKAYQMKEREYLSGAIPLLEVNQYEREYWQVKRDYLQSTLDLSLLTFEWNAISAAATGDY